MRPPSDSAAPSCALAFVGCMVGTLLVASGAAGAEWTRSASISAGGGYSDNVELDDDNEDSDLFGVLTPSVSMHGEGARASVDLNAALEMNTLGGGSGNFNPLVNAKGSAELIEDLFYTDVFANANQSTVDPFRASGNTALSDNENATTTYNYGVTPSIRKRFGSFASFEASTRWDEQISANDDFDNSTEQQYNARLSSGPDFARLSWGVAGEYRTTEYSNNAGGGSGQDDEYSEVRVPLGYRINRKWQLTGAAGHEWRDYDAAVSNDDDNTWDVGFVWTPNARTSLNAGYESQYGDESPRVDFSHRSKRTQFRASYDRTLTTARDLRARESAFGADNPFGLPFDPVTGQPVPLSGNSSFLESGSIIDERFRASVSLLGRRTTVTLTGSRSQQEREDNAQEGTFDDVYLDFNRKLSGKLSLVGGVTWRGDEDPDGLISDTMWYELGLQRQLGVNTSMSVNYTYSDRDSERPGDDYTENRVYVLFTFTL